MLNLIGLLIIIIMIIVILLPFNDNFWNYINKNKKHTKTTLIDDSENKIEKTIKRSEFIIENAHKIGRELENQFNKSNDTILEPYNISRIIGLIDQAIKSMKNKYKSE